MQLQSPVLITSRLLPGVRVGGGTISITYSDREGEGGRTRYRWFVDLDNGSEFTGDDLQSGCQGGSLQEGLVSLLSFLGAFAEAQRYPDSENADLFPSGLAEWATANSDEISMLESEIEETVGLIAE